MGDKLKRKLSADGQYSFPSPYLLTWQMKIMKNILLKKVQATKNFTFPSAHKTTYQSMISLVPHPFPITPWHRQPSFYGSLFTLSPPNTCHQSGTSELAFIQYRHAEIYRYTFSTQLQSFNLLASVEKGHKVNILLYTACCLN